MRVSPPNPEGHVAVAGQPRMVAHMTVLIGGIRKEVVARHVIIGGEKRPLPWDTPIVNLDEDLYIP